MIRKFATQTCKDKNRRHFRLFLSYFLQKRHGWRNKKHASALCQKNTGKYFLTLPPKKVLRQGVELCRRQCEAPRAASGGTPDGVSRDARILRKATRLLRTTLILLFPKIRLFPGRKVVCLLLLYKNFRLHLYENILNNCQNFQIKTLLN